MTLFIVYIYSPAQEILKGGNMEDESAWSITDVSASQTGFDPATITFNYTNDKPEGGQGGCLSISGYGITRNFLYQKVTLTKGHTYLLRGFLKDASDTNNLISNYWVEVDLVKIEPKIENFNGQTGTAIDFLSSHYDYYWGMQYWLNLNGVDYSRLTGYNGSMGKTLPFEWLYCGYNHTDSIISSPKDAAFPKAHGDSVIFTLPDTASTNVWYVLIKAGAFMTSGATEPSYNWLLDELSLWDLAQPTGISYLAAKTNKFVIYPNPITNGIVNIKLQSSNQIGYSVYNTLGMKVRSGLTRGNINLSDLGKGLYILSLENNSSIEQFKILLK
jgi:hypothetical protein